MDGTHIKVTTLIDTGCSKPILNKKFYDKHPYLHEMPHYAIPSIGVIVADDGVIKVTEAIQFMIKFHGHVFEFIAYLADMSVTFDFVVGQKCMYELEATVDYNNLVLHTPGVCPPPKPGSFQQTRVPNSLPMGVNHVDYEPQGTEVIPIHFQSTPL